jgi:hypothetical protein
MQENMALKKSGTSKIQKFHTQYLTKEKREIIVPDGSSRRFDRSFLNF